jgi:hypothetical protein
MIKFIPAAILMLLTFAPITNVAAQGVMVGGEGIVECGEYLKARRVTSETQTYVYATWVRGFVSGYNMATSGKPAPTVPGADTVLAYLDKHCLAKPLDLLATAAAEMVKELGATRR